MDLHQQHSFWPATQHLERSICNSAMPLQAVGINGDLGSVNDSGISPLSAARMGSAQAPGCGCRQQSDAPGGLLCLCYGVEGRFNCLAADRRLQPKSRWLWRGRAGCWLHGLRVFGGVGSAEAGFMARGVMPRCLSVFLSICPSFASASHSHRFLVVWSRLWGASSLIFNRNLIACCWSRTWFRNK